MPEEINTWWYSSEAKKFLFPDPNQGAYSAVQSRISMLGKNLDTHESYKDVVDL